MLKVAVTGNIGSGKTTICKVFETLGIPVFYADQQAKKLYYEPEIREKLINQFGNHLFDDDNNLIKTELAKLIFNNTTALEYINSLIHPKVFERFDQWASQQTHKPYCIQEAALTFESGNANRFDKIILVHAPEEQLIERTMKRDESSREQAMSRLSKQLPQSWKMEHAHYCIRNDHSSLVIPQILDIHAALTGNIL